MIHVRLNGSALCPCGLCLKNYFLLRASLVRPFVVHRHTIDVSSARALVSLPSRLVPNRQAQENRCQQQAGAGVGTNTTKGDSIDQGLLRRCCRWPLSKGLIRTGAARDRPRRNYDRKSHRHHLLQSNSLEKRSYGREIQRARPRRYAGSHRPPISSPLLKTISVHMRSCRRAGAPFPGVGRALPRFPARACFSLAASADSFLERGGVYSWCS